MSSFPAAEPVFSTSFDEPTPQAPVPSTERFVFTATGSEYFRIWIVNLLLTILTLGIYSAWAKVRRNRYFYDNTRLAGSSFEYHGNPLAILKGRVIAFVALVAYNLASNFNPIAALPLLVVFMAVWPWLAWKSLQFKLYNSSYRGIRFGFRGSAGQAYKVFLWLPILAGLTFWMLVPFVHQRIKKFQHEESRFGSTYFSFHAAADKFYMAYLLMTIFAMGGGTIIFILIIAGAVGTAAAGSKAAVMGAIFLGVALLYLWMFLLFPIFQTMLQKLIWNNTKLGSHQFNNDMDWKRLTFIMVTNLIAIILTLGLFIPFAKVRAMRYRIESMSMTSTESLDAFIADTQAKISATGEGVTDLLDFDLSL